MKSLSFSKFMIAVTVLAFVSSAFAGNNGRKESFEIASAIQVNGQTLPAGEYQAKWEGSGPNVEVSFVHAGKVMATAPATVVETTEKSANTSAELQGADGARQLNALHFSGKKYSLSFNGEATQAAR